MGKPNLAAIGLGRAAGSVRQRRDVPPAAAVSGSRADTKPITFHFPQAARDQLKILAVEQGRTMHELGAEALNDLFAKYGKPEVVAVETR